MTDGGMTLDEPGDRPPAPEPVRLVQLFVNTVDLEPGGPESLPDAAALHDWLVENELLNPHVRVTRAGHDRAIVLREALRALAYANGGHGLDPDAVATVNEATERARLQPVLIDDTRSELRPQASGL